jgi:hypothetical protein
LFNNGAFLLKILLENSRGSILLETLVSIVILGVIVVGSFYSYSFVYQRIQSQRQQRIALSVLQGWMERTISSLDLMGPNALNDLREEFESQIDTFFISDNQNIEPYIHIGNREGMTTIDIEISLNGLPISLYTEIDL